MEEINKQKIKVFRVLSNYVVLLEKYRENKNPKIEQEIDKLILENKGLALPLPSNRKGSFLALALEMNEFVGALYLINNAEKLAINTDYISFDIFQNSTWNLEEYINQLPNLTINFDINTLKSKYKNDPSKLEESITDALKNYNAFNIIKEYSKKNKKYL